MHISIMNPLRILLLAALILTASFPGCLDADSTDLEEINKPVAKIVSINPVNLTFGEVVFFTGEGTTDKGYIIGYDWGSSLDGFLSDEKTFSISNLSIGNHTIFFKVQNDDKIWSDRIESNLIVVSERQYSIFEVSEFTGNFRPSSTENLTEIINYTNYIIDNPLEFGNRNYSSIWESFNFTFEINETWESTFLILLLDLFVRIGSNSTL